MIFVGFREDSHSGCLYISLIHWRTNHVARGAVLHSPCSLVALMGWSILLLLSIEYSSSVGHLCAREWRSQTFLLCRAFSSQALLLYILDDLPKTQSGNRGVPRTLLYSGTVAEPPEYSSIEQTSQTNVFNAFIADLQRRMFVTLRSFASLDILGYSPRYWLRLCLIMLHSNFAVAQVAAAQLLATPCVLSSVGRSLHAR